MAMVLRSLVGLDFVFAHSGFEGIDVGFHRAGKLFPDFLKRVGRRSPDELWETSPVRKDYFDIRCRPMMSSAEAARAAAVRMWFQVVHSAR